jgi:hypothetical protein
MEQSSIGVKCFDLYRECIAFNAEKNILYNLPSTSKEWSKRSGIDEDGMFCIRTLGAGGMKELRGW